MNNIEINDSTGNFTSVGNAGNPAAGYASIDTDEPQYWIEEKLFFCTHIEITTENGGNVNLREEHNENCKVLITIPNGKVLEVKDRFSDGNRVWSLVTYSRYTGWVASNTKDGAYLYFSVANYDMVIFIEPKGVIQVRKRPGGEIYKDLTGPGITTIDGVLGLEHGTIVRPYYIPDGPPQQKTDSFGVTWMRIASWSKGSDSWTYSDKLHNVDASNDIDPRIVKLLESGVIASGKKESIRNIGNELFKKGFEASFVAGVLGNIMHEGKTGLFENSKYITNPNDEPPYLVYMDYYYNYRDKYADNCIYNSFSVSEVEKILKELPNKPKLKEHPEGPSKPWRNPWPKDWPWAGGFALGAVQWTWDRTTNLVKIYRNQIGTRDTITYEETLSAEGLMILDELCNASLYKGIYPDWLGNNSNDLYSEDAASNAADDIVRNYEKPSNMEDEAKKRKKTAKDIYNAMTGPIVISGITASVSTADIASVYKTYYCNVSVLNIREQPDADIVGKIQYGNSIMVLDTEQKKSGENLWVKVKYNNGEYWAALKSDEGEVYLTETAPSDLTAAPAQTESSINKSNVIVYSLKTDGDKQLSTNFQVKEFRCKDNSDKIKIDSALVSYLQQIRDWSGSLITITSGYRTEEYNKEKKGAVNSYHLYGMAADIRVSGKTIFETAIKAEALGMKGIIVYKDDNFTHVDTRTDKYFAIDSSGGIEKVKTFLG